VEAQHLDLAGVSSADELIRLIRLSDLISKRLLGIKGTDGDLELEQALFDSFPALSGEKDSFADPYFEKLKQHPFFELAA
jgi:hypothetical protein